VRSSAPRARRLPRRKRFEDAVRISPAALRVNVIAMISSGRSTMASRRRKRCVSSSVLPEPAGAWTMKLRSGASAASRLAWSAG
jgi:hypothetical protein